MKLIAHVIDCHHVDVRPAPVEREWMDETNQRFAYRCLALNIANAFGWQVLHPPQAEALQAAKLGLQRLAQERKP